MALDDFARQDPATGAKNAAAAGEVEDLFDFPVVEMTADAGGAPPQKSKSERGASTPPPALPSKKKPVAAPPPSMDLAYADAPVRAGATQADPSGRTSSEQPRDGAGPDGTSPSPVHAPAPRVHARTLPPIAEVAAAVATAIAEQEPVEADGSDVESPDVDAHEQPREARREITAVLAWTAIAALALVNVAGFFALWRSNRSFASTVDGLRDDLAVAAHDQDVATGAGRTVEPRADVAAAPDARDEARATRIESSPEETALALARKEIELGRFAAARMRLHRLLAIADRFDSSTRADLEARASFLVSESYAVQLERRLETAR